MSDDDIRDAEVLWGLGFTYPEIAQLLAATVQEVYMPLESRRLRPWCAVRSVPAAEHEVRRYREAKQLVLEAEGFLAKVAA